MGTGQAANAALSFNFSLQFCFNTWGATLVRPWQAITEFRWSASLVRQHLVRPHLPISKERSLPIACNVSWWCTITWKRVADIFQICQYCDNIVRYVDVIRKRYANVLTSSMRSAPYQVLPALNNIALMTHIYIRVDNTETNNNNNITKLKYPFDS